MLEPLADGTTAEIVSHQAIGMAAFCMTEVAVRKMLSLGWRAAMASFPDELGACVLVCKIIVKGERYCKYAEFFYKRYCALGTGCVEQLLDRRTRRIAWMT